MPDDANELVCLRLSVIGAKAQQLEGLLNLCYGGGFEQFDCLIEPLKDSVLELAANLASQIGRIADGVENV